VFALCLDIRRSQPRRKQPQEELEQKGRDHDEEMVVANPFQLDRVCGEFVQQIFRHFSDAAGRQCAQKASHVAHGRAVEECMRPGTSGPDVVCLLNHLCIEEMAALEQCWAAPDVSNTSAPDKQHCQRHVFALCDCFQGSVVSFLVDAQPLGQCLSRSHFNN